MVLTTIVISCFDFTVLKKVSYKCHNTVKPSFAVRTVWEIGANVSHF